MMGVTWQEVDIMAKEEEERKKKAARITPSTEQESATAPTNPMGMLPLPFAGGQPSTSTTPGMMAPLTNPAGFGLGGMGTTTPGSLFGNPQATPAPAFAATSSL
jgi:hypothetical protein